MTKVRFALNGQSRNTLIARIPAVRVGAATVVAFGLAIYFANLFGWLYRIDTWVDINSGRVRRTTAVCSIPIEVTFEETWISRHVDRVQGPPNWKIANVHRSGGHFPSPHFRYHAAAHQSLKLKLLHELYPFPPERRAELAGEVVALWQTGSDHDAERFLRRLTERLSHQPSGS